MSIDESRPGVRALIGLGSNVDDRVRNLEEAVSRLAAAPAIEIVHRSYLYETEPVGGPPQKKFLNAVVSIETVLEPRDLLRVLQSIEDALGRRREERSGPRTLDLDILFYGSVEINENGLIVPHPRVRERAFVLVPLADIAPDFVHPGCGLRISTLLERVEGRSGVKLYGSDRWRSLAT